MEPTTLLSSLHRQLHHLSHHRLHYCPHQLLHQMHHWLHHRISHITSPTTPLVLLPSMPPLDPPDDFHLTSNPFGPSTTVTLTTKGTHPTLGLDIHHHSDTSRIVLRSCFPSTPAARIPRWRSTLRESYIIALDDTPVTTIEDVTRHIAAARSSSAKSIVFTMVPPEHINSTSDTNIPQIHFDQMTIMAHQQHSAKHDTPPWSDPHNTPPVSDSNIFAAMDRGQIKPCLTHAFLKRQSD